MATKRVFAHECTVTRVSEVVDFSLKAAKDLPFHELQAGPILTEDTLYQTSGEK